MEAGGGHLSGVEQRPGGSSSSTGVRGGDSGEPASQRPIALQAAEAVKSSVDAAEADLKYGGEGRDSTGDVDDSWGERSRTSSFSASSAGGMSRGGSMDSLAAAESATHRRTLNIPPTPPGSGEPTPTAFGKRRGSTATGHTKSVALVGLIGFHHVHGHRVEWTFPEKTRDWRHLAMLCLPEGAHNVIDGFGHVYFSIELALEEDQQKEIYFGVSVYGQIKTTELLVREEAETRSYVQKAVVLLAREPFYGWMHAQLRPAAMDLFRQRDFSDRVLLEQLLRGLWERHPEELDKVDWHEGLSPTQLVRRFGRNTLLLYKLMLLEPRMVLYAETSDLASTLLLSLVSLVPGLLPSFSPFHQLHCLEQVFDPASQSGGSVSGTSESELSLDTSFKRPSFSWSEEGSSAQSPSDQPHAATYAPFSESRTAVPMSLLQGPNFLSPTTTHSTLPPPPPPNSREVSREVSGLTSTSAFDPRPSNPSPISTRSQLSAEERQLAWRRVHGLPLHVFHRKCKLEPYLPMELLMMGAAAKHSAVLAGSSNKYLLQATMLPQLALGALANAETGEVQIFKEGLEKARKLSGKERKFAEDIANRVSASANPDASPEGRGSQEEATDVWVRGRFEEYTLRLLQAAARQQHAWTMPTDDDETRRLYDTELPRVHGTAWSEAWASTHNYGRWLAEHSPTIVSHSKPAGGGSISAELKTSLKDIRQTLRDTVGASSGIRAAMKSRVFSLFNSSSSTNLHDDDAGSGISSPPPGRSSPLPGDDRRQRRSQGSQGQLSRDESPGGGGRGGGGGSQSPFRRSQSPGGRQRPSQPRAVAALPESSLDAGAPDGGMHRRCNSDLEWRVVRREAGGASGGGGAGREFVFRTAGKVVRAQTEDLAVMDAALRSSERRRSSLAEPGTPGGLRRSSSSGPQPSKRRSVGMLPEHVSAIFAGMGLGSQG